MAKKSAVNAAKRKKRPHPKRDRPSGAQGAPVKKRRRRRGRQTLNYLFFGIVGSIVLAILCYTVFFRVYHIEVLGDETRYTKEEIISASGIQDKESLFAVSQNKVNAALVSKLPYVQGVNATKHFPTTVRLQIRAAKIAGAVKTEEEGYLYIGTDGRILESGIADYDRQYPLITGLTLTATNPGAYVLGQNSEQISMLRDLYEAMERNKFTDITHIALNNRLNLQLVYQDRLLIELGTEAELDYKISLIKETIARKPSTAEGVLDATMTKWVTSSDTDIAPLLEELRQGGAGEGESGGEKEGIRVDPKTGALIVGPKDPLNQSSGPPVGAAPDPAGGLPGANAPSLGSGAQSAGGSSSISGGSSSGSSSGGGVVLGPKSSSSGGGVVLGPNSSSSGSSSSKPSYIRQSASSSTPPSEKSSSESASSRGN